MDRNVGTTDRMLRIVAGLAMLSLVLLIDSPARGFGLIGLVPLLTGALGYCPVYHLLGFTTCPLAIRRR